MTINKKVNIIYLLKKNDYYCFINKTKSGTLSLLNGGALKKLDYDNIQYYYDNMDKVIARLQPPLNEYNNYQKKIADEIINIGGSGRIHGCIIDIDFYNHIYVNPFDATLTAYWASDIINKLVYPDIRTLLKNECPSLYSNYLELLERRNVKVLAIKQSETKVLAQEYLDTDIYRASNEIKKMQKLSSNVLTPWCNIKPDIKALPNK